MVYSPKTGEQLGRRDTCLLIFGFIQLMVGVAIFIVPAIPGRSRTIPVLELIAPPAVWASVWIALGVIVLVSAFERANRQRLGCVLAWGTPFLWSAAWLISFILGIAPLGWLAAVVYVGYAGLALVVSGWEEPLKPPPPGTFGGHAK